MASLMAYDPATELHKMPVGEVLERLRALKVDLVVISGGEPLSQQRRLIMLLRQLGAEGIAVEMETNGTHVPGPELCQLVRRFVVSPKLSHSGDPLQRRLRPTALAAFRDCGRAEFKFVVQSVSDLDEVAHIVEQNRLTPVWIMPEGKQPSEVLSTLSEIADSVVQRRWNLTSRLHILAWGDLRGV